ncbi:MAG: hypothetical protein P4L84_11005 [Isosphaeraceae bacterium]|nr:hypothetical protein [Isosphaeraceae bacterium]
MWTWLGYPSTPVMPAGAFPFLAKLALTKSEGMHAWEGVWRMGVDAGRTEGAMIASACWLSLILATLLAAFFLAMFFLTIWFVFWRKRG